MVFGQDPARDVLIPRRTRIFGNKFCAGGWRRQSCSTASSLQLVDFPRLDNPGPVRDPFTIQAGNSKPSSQASFVPHCKLAVFRFGLLEDRDVGVGVFPEAEEILVGSLCLAPISRQSERPAQLQARQCAYGIGENDARVVEDLLELRGGFGAPMRQQTGLAAQVHRIEVSEETRPATRYGELIRSCDLQQLDGVRRIAMAQRPKRPKSWQVVESDVCILRCLF